MTEAEPPNPPPAEPGKAALAARLRVMVLTDPRPACGRSPVEVARECVAAGATAVQLRDKSATGRELWEQAVLLASVLAGTGALLLVNDRLDVALAAGAHGVHLGPDDLPVDRARALCPPGFVIGYSTDRTEEARAAARAGADYLGVGAVFGTDSKPGLRSEAIGPRRVRAVLEAAGLPGVGIGGITPENAGAVASTGAGVAVLGAVMRSPDPARVVKALRAAVDRAWAKQT